jgi:hypothetical protein
MGALDYIARTLAIGRVRPDLIDRISAGTMTVEGAEIAAGLWRVVQLADDGPTAWEVTRSTPAGSEFAGSHPAREAAMRRADMLNATEQDDAR